MGNTEKNRDWLIVDTRQSVGNALLFWGPDRCGYFCDINKAGRYTEDEAKAQSRRRSSDRAVRLCDALEHSQTIVRCDTGVAEAFWTPPKEGGRP